jgi:hypothetical protein
MNKIQFIKEFENMRYMSELKALSNISQERPLSDKEFNRVKQLSKLFNIGG